MERKVNHAEEGIRIIDEFFRTDAEMSEEAKLWEGLSLAVDRNWMSLEEADACLQAYIDGKEETPNAGA